ncbi:MAG TPA: hypothetical protein VGH97_12340 [Thermoanaerobaculia bacterium]|jgi:photosystem II stability/assembly factor-like uncharacterized protein
MIGVLLAASLLASEPRAPVEPPGSWTTHGPYGGSVGFVIDPGNSATIYAAGGGDIFRSRDRGASWSSIGLPSGALAISPSDPRVVYAGQFRSTDGGVTWTPTTPPFDSGGGILGGITAFAVDPLDSEIVYAAVSITDFSVDFAPIEVQVFKSVDGEQTWTLIYDTGRAYQANYSARGLVVDPGNPASVHLALNQSLLNSTDGGLHWSPALDVGTYVIANLAVASGGPLYSGTYLGGVFRSDDDGLTWSPINAGLPADALAATAVVTAQADASKVFVVTSAGIFVSDNGGASWAQRSDLVGGSLAVDPRDSSRLYWSGRDERVLVSDDEGLHWYESDTGLRSTTQLGVCVDPADPSRVFAALAGSVARSTDRGSHWSIPSAGFPADSIPSLVIADPRDASVLYAAAGYSGVFRSADAGVHWVAINEGLGEAPYYYVSWIALDPENPGVLYAATHLGVFRTNDGGGWSPANAGLGGKQRGMVVVDPNDGSLLYAPLLGSGLFRSRDSGASWSPTGLMSQVLYVAIDPRDSSHLLAGTSLGLVHSVDGGQTWNPTGLTSVVLSLVFDPRSSSVVYAVAGGGVLRSGDSGQTWTRFGAGLPDSDFETFTSVHGEFLAIDPSGTPLYVATPRHGVYSLSMRETTRTLPARPVR